MAPFNVVIVVVFVVIVVVVVVVGCCSAIGSIADFRRLALN